MPSAEEILARAEEYADKFESYEPKPGDRGRVTPTVLRMAAYRSATADSDLAGVIREAHAQGMTWAEIGDVIGEIAEKAERRYGESRP